ncbi:MAG: hypothetical protein Q4B42_00525 [Oscillospiraceae bacterium]|nr:hypothetical protein [Oscillospiraceae bacterium]
MKKENLYKLFYAAAGLAVLGFALRLGADLLKYDASCSAPFYVFALARAPEFLLPAALLFFAARFTKKKYGK